jgi:hypothetical protein
MLLTQRKRSLTSSIMFLCFIGLSLCDHVVRHQRDGGASAPDVHAAHHAALVSLVASHQ